MATLAEELTWFGHDSFKWETQGRIIYLDPWNHGGPAADYIFITHEHFDHCCPDTVKNLVKPDGETIIITEPVSLGKLKEAGIKADYRSMAPGDEYSDDVLKVLALPSYNLNKTFHPRDRNFLGFIINDGQMRLYMAGDTDFIPEMEGLAPDAALLPIAGTYTMDALEAAQAVKAIKPGLVIPMHYGKLDFGHGCLEEFKAALGHTAPLMVKPQMS